MYIIIYSISLTQQLIQSKNASLILSPFSIHNDLTMAALGAQGQTYCEMHRALRLYDNRFQVAQQYQRLIYQLHSVQSVMKVANRIYIQNESKLKNEFSSMLATYFQTTATSLDFQQADKAAAIINKDVSEATNNKIQNIIPANVLSATTKMVLVNAIHFHSNWQNQFHIGLTGYRQFFTANGISSNIKMMRQTVGY